MAQPDPFQWARDFYNMSSQRAAQEQNDAQRSLLSVFQVEAQRQQPWSDLPVDLAKMQERHRLAMEEIGLRGDYLDKRRTSRNNQKWMEPGKLGTMIQKTAETFGLDPAYMLALGQYESGFRPNAVSPTGAKGLFQFVGGTAQQYGLTDPFDPVQNTAAAARFTLDNAKRLQANGIEPTPANLYLAHQQGVTGAIRLLTNPSAPAGSVTDPKNISVNNGDPNASAAAFVQQHTSAFMSLYNQHHQRLAKGGADPRLQVVIDAFTKGGTDPDAAEAEQDAADDAEDEAELHPTVNGNQY